MSSTHVLSVKLYAIVFGTLLLLTLTTTGMAFADLGAAWNGVVALAIAVGKALLVILFFMHVRYSDHLTWVFVAAGFFWLAILIGGTVDDVITRPQFSPQKTAVSAGAETAEPAHPLDRR